jgi:2-keto-4-pentenoate hydratase
MTLDAIGPAAGWKVGAVWKTGAAMPEKEIFCAPLPASGVHLTGVRKLGGSMRGVEVEVAVRLKSDLPCPDGVLTHRELLQAVDAILPAIEIVETRLIDWRTSDPLAQLADLSTHGGLVLGEPSRMSPHDLDMRRVEGSVVVDGKPLESYVDFYGQAMSTTRGANHGEEIWRAIEWLALHCARRGFPLKSGQVVTTGSFTGLYFAPEGAEIVGELKGIGRVELSF